MQHFPVPDHPDSAGQVGRLLHSERKGIEVARALASELNLACPEPHGIRNEIAWLLLICACGVLTGSLGKMAGDISLLMQAEVAEAAEPGSEGRGGSSTMPHKRNPIGCALTLAAAQRVPALVASFLSGMVQQHERGVGGWQAEWPTVAAIIQATGLAAASMAEVAEGLTVDKARMRSNIEATHGAIFAERATDASRSKVGTRCRPQDFARSGEEKFEAKTSFVGSACGNPEVYQPP